MTSVSKKTVTLLILQGMFLFPIFITNFAQGATHDPGTAVTVKAGSSKQTLSPQDRDVIEKIQGTSQNTQAAIEKYATFQRKLLELFDDEGMEEKDRLAQLDLLMEGLGSGDVESFSEIHIALAERYRQSPVLTYLIRARLQTTRALLDSSSLSLTQRVVLEGRVRRFASLINLPDATARKVLDRYTRAVSEDNLAARASILAEVLTSEGKRFRRVLEEALSQQPTFLGNDSLEQDLLKAADWVEGKRPRSEDPLRAAFVAAYDGDKGRASQNRSNFWGLIEESEEARLNGDEKKVATVADELRNRWGANMGAFLEGMRKQAVALDATEAEKRQAQEVLSRLTAALGEERKQGKKRQVVLNAGDESEPVVIHESTDTTPWKPDDWKVADRLTDHFRERTDPFERSQLLNTPFTPLPHQLAGKGARGNQGAQGQAGPSGFVPPAQDSDHLSEVPSGGNRTDRSPAEGPDKPKRPKIKLKLTLTDCECFPELWYQGVKKRIKASEDNVISGDLPPESLGGAIKTQLEEAGYDVELTWKIGVEDGVGFSLYLGDDEEGNRLFSSSTRANTTNTPIDYTVGAEGDSTIGFYPAAESAPGNSAALTAVVSNPPVLNYNPLQENFNIDVVRKMDWARVLSYGLPRHLHLTDR